MKSLYTILGVSLDATTEQLDDAYARLSAQLQEGSAVPGSETQTQLVAVKEAYGVLSNPLARQRYNQKILTATTTDANFAMEMVEERPDFFSLKKIAAIGFIALAGIWLYSHQARERENDRIAHEHEIEMKAIQLLEKQHNLRENVVDTQLDRQKTQDNMAIERANQAERDRALRESDMRMRQNQREEEMRVQNQKRDAERQARQDEYQRQQQANATRQQVERDKRYLQQLEYEHYGRVITR